MTLPAALLIASSIDPLTAEEILETIGDKAYLLESLSCKCKDHSENQQLVAPSSSCSSEKSSSTSDLGSEISGSSGTTKKSCSYFSDSNTTEEILHSGSVKPRSHEDVLKCLKWATNTIDNVEARFNGSFVFKNTEEPKIMYQGRNILDLGSHLREPFPLTPSRMEPIKKESFNKYFPKDGVEERCPVKDCDFHYLHPFPY